MYPSYTLYSNHRFWNKSQRCLKNRSLKIKDELGFKDGPMISSTKGSLWNSKDIDGLLGEILIKIFNENRQIFPPEIMTEEDVLKGYQCFRSFRRSSNSRAVEMKVSPMDIDIVNRWKKVEAAKGKRTNLPMKQHYAEISILLAPFLRYTKAM